MICLNKLQDTLSDILEIDKSTLPDIKEILKSQGYTSIKKGEEIIELQPLHNPNEPLATNEPMNTTAHNAQTPNEPMQTKPEHTTNTIQDITFKDDKGNTHTISPATQEQWLKTFNLKSLNEDFIPTQSKEVKEALENKDIKLQMGSLKKLVAQGREQYMSEIKEVLENPEAIIKDPAGDYLLIKHLKDDDYFVNVSFDNGEYLISISNGIKERNNIKNKLNAGAKVLYQSPNANSILQTLLQASRYSTNGTDNPIIPQNKVTFEKPPTPFEKALREKQEMLNKKQAELEKKEAIYAQNAKAQKEAREHILKQKEALAGLKENDRILNIGESITMQKVPHLKSSISLDDENIYSLDFAIVKANDLKPNFNSTGVQLRTQANDKVIEKIANDFKPEMIFNRGGFDDLPIILSDGQVLSGNHRTAGMQNFTPQSRSTYNKAIKEAYNVELKDDELLVRIPQGELNTKELINLASASNLERVSNIGDKVIASLGKYDKHIQELGKIESENVEELASTVAKALDKNSSQPELESPNLALLAYNARNSDELSLSNVFNTLSKELDIEDFNTLKDMYIKNAGSFHNILKDSELRDLHLQEFLLRAIKASGQGLKKSRSENFNNLNDKLEYIIHNTDEQGSNTLIKETPSYYDDTIGEALGYALTRFARLENPEANLFEFMHNAKENLRNQVAPSLINPAGKSVKEADIFDFIELAIQSGEPSEATAKAVNYLPALREKYKAFKGSIETNPTNAHNAQEAPAKALESTNDKIANEPMQKNDEANSNDIILYSKQQSNAELESLPSLSPEEFKDFIAKAGDGYDNIPQILKIAELNNELKALINNDKNANVYITRARAAYISPHRKGNDKALRMDELGQIPQVISNTQEVYKDGRNAYLIPLNYKQGSSKIKFIVLDSDNEGNFLARLKKVNISDLENLNYKKITKTGVEPARITTKDIPPPLKDKQGNFYRILSTDEELQLAKDDFKSFSKYLESPFANATQDEQQAMRLELLQNTDPDVFKELVEVNKKILEIRDEKKTQWQRLIHYLNPTLSNLTNEQKQIFKDEIKEREQLEKILKPNEQKIMSLFTENIQPHPSLNSALMMKYKVKGNSFTEEDIKKFLEKNNDSDKLTPTVENDTTRNAKQSNAPSGDNALPTLIERQYNLNNKDDYNTISDYWHKASRDKDNAEISTLFDKVLDTAKKLNVKVKFHSYIPLRLQAGSYHLDINTAKISINTQDPNPSQILPTLPASQTAEIMLHELIHSTIARAQYLRKKAYHILTPPQINALNNIEQLYKIAKDQANSQEKQLYGLTSESEFIAELANPKFREYLKSKNIFKQVIEAIVNFFTYLAPETAKQTNIYNELRIALETFIDNYDNKAINGLEYLMQNRGAPTLPPKTKDPTPTHQRRTRNAQQTNEQQRMRFDNPQTPITNAGDSTIDKKPIDTQTPEQTQATTTNEPMQTKPKPQESIKQYKKPQQLTLFYIQAKEHFKPHTWRYAQQQLLAHINRDVQKELQARS